MPDEAQAEPDGNVKEGKNYCPWKKIFLSGVEVWAGILVIVFPQVKTKGNGISENTVNGGIEEKYVLELTSVLG